MSTPATLLPNISVAPGQGGDAPLAALAAELAAKLLPLSDILNRYGMTPAELTVLMKDQQFTHMVKEFRREWHSPLSAKERVKVKASLVVEDGLIALHTMFYDDDIAPAARLDAYKQLVALADMQPKKEADAAIGGGFSISINIPAPNGEATKAVVIEQQDSDAEL